MCARALLAQDVAHTPPAQPAPNPAAAVASPFNKMFQAWGISLGGAQPATPPLPPGVGVPASAAAARPAGPLGGSAGGVQHPPLPRPAGNGAVSSSEGGALAAASAAAAAAAAALPSVRQAPGAALVTWALTDGKPVIEQVWGPVRNRSKGERNQGALPVCFLALTVAVPALPWNVVGVCVCVRACAQLFSVSRTLDGEAVVVYFRALCAVSTEELDLPHRPRTAYLHRLVQCAHANAGESLGAPAHPPTRPPT